MPPSEHLILQDPWGKDEDEHCIKQKDTQLSKACSGGFINKHFWNLISGRMGAQRWHGARLRAFHRQPSSPPHTLMPPCADMQAHAWRMESADRLNPLNGLAGSYYNFYASCAISRLSTKRAGCGQRNQLAHQARQCNAIARSGESSWVRDRQQHWSKHHESRHLRWPCTKKRAKITVQYPKSWKRGEKYSWNFNSCHTIDKNIS